MTIEEAANRYNVVLISRHDKSGGATKAINLVMSAASLTRNGP